MDPCEQAIIFYNRPLRKQRSDKSHLGYLSMSNKMELTSSYLGHWKLDIYTPCIAEQNRWDKLPSGNAEVPKNVKASGDRQLS